MEHLKHLDEAPRLSVTCNPTAQPWFLVSETEGLCSVPQPRRNITYLSSIPGLVLQRPREDVVTQVEDKEADDEQWTHECPHDLPVPVEGAASHGSKVAFKSVWTTGREPGGRGSSVHTLCT